MSKAVISKTDHPEIPVYTVRAAASLLGYRMSYMRQLLHFKKLGSIKIGGRVLITQEHIDSWIERNTKLREATQ